MTAMFLGFRERELVLNLFELITGLRMNHGYIRPAVWPRICRTTQSPKSASSST
ncbi:respiratory-chain NADH dehydrogenase, 49 Kd subunit [Mycobacterium xenopi 3993]|nr:respiratory-chain NADH dehydrogenase, 49 Kd subunit [Mycobacterium xenopi 3993]